MKATRREALIAALVVPAAVAVPAAARARGAITLYDPTLGIAVPPGARPIVGDTIRFAQRQLATRPALILGATRHADALLIADAAREAGYRAVAAPAALGPFGWALARKA